jgi:transketolase
MTSEELILQSEKNRKRLLEVVYNAKAGHIGGDLSCLNVMTALYTRIMNISPSQVNDPDRDRFILSKGHCVESLYTVLESRGFIKPELVNTLGRFGSVLSGHPTIEVPGI